MVATVRRSGSTGTSSTVIVSIRSLLPRRPAPAGVCRRDQAAAHHLLDLGAAEMPRLCQPRVSSRRTSLMTHSSTSVLVVRIIFVMLVRQPRDPVDQLLP